MEAKKLIIGNTYYLYSDSASQCLVLLKEKYKKIEKKFAILKLLRIFAL